MEFQTTREWNEASWNALQDVYIQAFPYGRKNRNIVRRLMENREAFLHIEVEEQEVMAMAISAKLEEINALVIDYLGVREDMRGRGIGAELVGDLKTWAKQEGFDGLVIEVESERNPEPNEHPNVRRIHFWEKCGFQKTDYIHDYKIVPELYRAMFFHLTSDSKVPEDGETLFMHMSKYHKRAWSRR